MTENVNAVKCMHCGTQTANMSMYSDHGLPLETATFRFVRCLACNKIIVVDTSQHRVIWPLAADQTPEGVPPLVAEAYSDAMLALAAGSKIGRRMPQEGMLVQIDGSHHSWLEDRGPKLVLLLAVDDATGTVAQAVFRSSEDTRGYLTLLEGLIRQWGIPLALYSDRHSAFKYNARRVPVLVEPTQFASVMRELGIRQIFALSPQAKGRVERMASTFQDRLVTELRLAGASTMEQANAVLKEFLPHFNARFAVAPEQHEKAYRPVPAELSLTETISIEAHPKGGPGQHGQIQVANPATATRNGPAQLCRSEGGGPGASRWQADTQVPG